MLCCVIPFPLYRFVSYRFLLAPLSPLPFHRKIRYRCLTKDARMVTEEGTENSKTTETIGRSCRVKINVLSKVPEKECYAAEDKNTCISVATGCVEDREVCRGQRSSTLGRVYFPPLLKGSNDDPPPYITPDVIACPNRVSYALRCLRTYCAH